MKRLQGEAATRAVRGPDLQAQEELRRKRHAEEHSLAERRKVAWFALAGVVAGAGAACFVTGDRCTVGALWGGIVASAVGWLFIARAQRRNVH